MRLQTHNIPEDHSAENLHRCLLKLCNSGRSENKESQQIEAQTSSCPVKLLIEIDLVVLATT